MASVDEEAPRPDDFYHFHQLPNNNHNPTSSPLHPGETSANFSSFSPGCSQVTMPSLRSGLPDSSSSVTTGYLLAPFGRVPLQSCSGLSTIPQVADDVSSALSSTQNPITAITLIPNSTFTAVPTTPSSKVIGFVRLSSIALSSSDPFLVDLGLSRQSLFLEVRARSFVALTNKMIPTRGVLRSISVEWTVNWQVPIVAVAAVTEQGRGRNLSSSSVLTTSSVEVSKDSKIGQESVDGGVNILEIDIKTHGATFSGNVITTLSIDMDPFPNPGQLIRHRLELDTGSLLVTFAAVAPSPTSPTTLPESTSTLEPQSIVPLTICDRISKHRNPTTNKSKKRSGAKATKSGGVMIPSTSSSLSSVRLHRERERRGWPEWVSCLFGWMGRGRTSAKAAQEAPVLGVPRASDPSNVQG